MIWLGLFVKKKNLIIEFYFHVIWIGYNLSKISVIDKCTLGLINYNEISALYARLQLKHQTKDTPNFFWKILEKSRDENET